MNHFATTKLVAETVKDFFYDGKKRYMSNVVIDEDGFDNYLGSFNWTEDVNEAFDFSKDNKTANDIQRMLDEFFGNRNMKVKTVYLDEEEEE